MAYKINNTFGTLLVTLADGTIDVATTDLTLIGKGYAGFGLGDAILIFSICLHLGLPLGIYAITLASLGLLVKILWVKRYKEQHAFGSWLGSSFLVITLYQEFYEFEGLASI